MHVTQSCARSLRTPLFIVALVLTAAGGGSGSWADSVSTATQERTTHAAAVSAPAAAATAISIVFGADVGYDVPGTAAFANARATGDVVRRVRPRLVLMGGDGAYPDGTLKQYLIRYQPVWGSFKAATKPSPGNHEYQTPGATGYYAYWFGGKPTPYYAYALGNDWRGYSLNCEIACGAKSAELAWLRRDLARHPDSHVLAVVHEPRYSSSMHGSDRRIAPIFDVLVRARADLLLSGHDHGYEAFTKQDSSGRAMAAGVQQFVAGSGGARMYTMKRPLKNSIQRNITDFGVLRLNLRDGSYYSWAFIGSGRCWRPREGSYTCASHRGKTLHSGARYTNVAR